MSSLRGLSIGLIAAALGVAPVVAIAANASAAAGPNASQPSASQTSSSQPGASAGQPLSMQAAINDALANNTQALLAGAREDEAGGKQVQARAAFLPHLSAKVSQARRQTNLAAQGFNFGSDIGNAPAGAPGIGFSFPTTVTYNNFDARAELRQTLFNYSAWEDYQSAKAGSQAARAQLAVARQQVATQAELDYVADASAEASVQAAQADVRQAKALLHLARDQAQVGTATGLDVTRARARLARDQATLAERRAEATRRRIQLARTLGLNQGTPIHLTDPLVFRPMSPGTAAGDIATALADRPEMTLARLEIAERQHDLASAKGQRLPTLGLEADYGESGNTPGMNSRPTYAVGATLSMPIFDGGLVSGRIDSAAARLDEQQIHLHDTREKIEQDVRTSRDTIGELSAGVRAARANVTLAREELKRARDRFAHGVGDNVELIDAQSALSAARTQRINALAEYTRARINLAAALGRAEQFSLSHPMTP